jgi:hypothetical protein
MQESCKPTLLEVVKSYRWPLVFIMAALAFIIATLISYKMGTKDNASSDKDSINKSFREYITSIQGTENLDVAMYHACETFSNNSSDKTNNSSDKTNTFWRKVLSPLVTTNVEIRVSVTYRYHIPLDDPNWDIRFYGNICAVSAPQIRPTLPVAIHTDEMEKKIYEGWTRFNGHELADALEKSITPELERRAKKAIPLVLEHSRQKVASFVRKWIIHNPQWEDNLHAITVSFPGENRSNSKDIVIDHDSIDHDSTL